MPANIELSGMEVSLVNAMSRETILRQYIDSVKRNYNFVLIDCMPSLGMMTVNALAAADAVLIPVQAEYLPVKGLVPVAGLEPTRYHYQRILSRSSCLDFFGTYCTVEVIPDPKKPHETSTFSPNPSRKSATADFLQKITLRRFFELWR
jgi:cellulose biosynthesis protein BcsQ